jgi:integrase
LGHQRCGHDKLATVKLIASVRHWLDFLTEKGVLQSNPTHAVRTPRLVVREGNTPIFEKAEARALFTSLSGESLLERRDRAICSIILYPPFTRVGAVVAMQVRDFEDSALPFIVLHEKGGVERREACHHKTAEYVRAYLDAAPALRDMPHAPLFSRSSCAWRDRSGIFPASMRIRSSTSAPFPAAASNCRKKVAMVSGSTGILMHQVSRSGAATSTVLEAERSRYGPGSMAGAARSANSLPAANGGIPDSIC